MTEAAAISPPPEQLLETAAQLYRAGNIDGAGALLDQALAIDAGNADALHLQGCVALYRNDLAGAESSMRRAFELAPKKAEFIGDLGVVLFRMGRKTEALECFGSAYRLNPRGAIFARNAAEIFQMHWNPLAAAEWMERAAAVAGDQAEVLAQLGGMYRDLGRPTEAVACLTRALEVNPDELGVRLRRAVARLAVCYANEEEARRARQRYAQDLEDLERRAENASQELLAAAAPSVGSMTTFYLPYQGEDDRELQERYGRLVTKIIHARYPELAARPPLPAAKRGQPIRVGILSAWLYSSHSNWKMPIRGWIENLDPSRFQLYGYHVGHRDYPGIDEIKEKFQGRYANCAEMEIADVAARVRADALHVLIYPEIGMWPRVSQLAAFRLAPIQCSSWGHPETSGLSTIDYFLSSELMEPEDGDRYYSEALIRLPKLSICYTPPEVDRVERKRTDFGLDENSVLYFCAQSLFKYLPQHDFVFVEIAKRVANAQFVFLGDFFSPEQSARVKRRIEQALAAAGLDASRKVVMMSTRLPVEQFHALARLCDVYLDSLGWSGCNSAMEAMQNGLPVATLPGRFMRGRHTYAFLKLMGLEQLIVSTEAEYIDLMARLGNDPAFRAQMNQEIGKALPRLQGDLDCVRGLAEFLKTAVKHRRAEEKRPGAEPAGGKETPLLQRLERQIVQTLGEHIPKGRRVALVDFPETIDCGSLAAWAGELALLARLESPPAYQCSARNYDRDAMREALSKDGLVLVHGGGAVTDDSSRALREAVLREFPGHEAIVLPGALEFSTDDALRSFASACNRGKRAGPGRVTLCVRDEAEMQLAKTHFARCQLLMIPDLTFALGRQPRMASPSLEILWIARTDEHSAYEKGAAIRQLHARAMQDAIARVDGFPVTAQMPLCAGENVHVGDWAEFRFSDEESAKAYASLPFQRKAILQFAWGKLILSMARTVITDRLQVHIQCLLLGIPHVLLDERRGALRRYYEKWTHASPLVRFADNPEQAISIAREWAAAYRVTGEDRNPAPAIEAVVRTGLARNTAQELAAIAEACAAVEQAGVPGLFVQAGCEAEGTALVIARTKARGRRFRAFADAYHDPEVQARIRENLARLGVISAADGMEFILGVSADTMRIREPIAFAHIGQDRLDSLPLCMERLIPMLSPGAIVLIDGYVDNEIRQQPIMNFFVGLEDDFKFEILPTGQLRIRRRTAQLEHASDA
jgi:predicted O-linked N-acetylglucosamine transferase (SPINDLY family)/exopolysaccharide biosynthesis predicted pyruvyltransferase EpsI